MFTVPDLRCIKSKSCFTSIFNVHTWTVDKDRHIWPSHTNTAFSNSNNEFAWPLHFGVYYLTETVTIEWTGRHFVSDSRMAPGSIACWLLLLLLRSMGCRKRLLITFLGNHSIAGHCFNLQRVDHRMSQHEFKRRPFYHVQFQPFAKRKESM